MKITKLWNLSDLLLLNVVSAAPPTFSIGNTFRLRKQERTLQLYRTLEESSRIAGDVLSGFILIEEDFFIHTKRARAFLDCIRKGSRPLSIMGFGSIKGLSQFTAEEIAQMGFDIIWTAFEGLGSGYDKLKVKNIPQLHEDLQAKGVAMLSYMIIGSPYQDPVQVREEVRQFQALKPALWQVLIYFAFPGAPLHKKALAEKRFLPAYE